ncbi:DUF4124 domain-containing protein [Uliginosibacterium sp. sgz301328]|uniref:DUF4124 domain-containing protein n=1 Tax=Uliginosibacterium sp. sgz301328 TaxID=3243764 RepID=UPI00359EE1B9
MTLRLCASAFVCLLIVPACAVAEVYRWTDRDGRVHYGDQPPAGVSARRVDASVNVVPAVPRAPAQPAAPAVPAAPPSANTPPQPASPPDPQDELRARMLAQCRQNRGIDCENEVEAMLTPPWNGYIEAPWWPVWGIAPPRPRPPSPPRPEPPRPPKPKPDPVPKPTPAPTPKPVQPRRGWSFERWE